MRTNRPAASTRPRALQVGDSRAVLGRRKDKAWTAFELSHDHKPTRPSEHRRILALGGLVGRSLKEAQSGDVAKRAGGACPVFCFGANADSPMRCYPGGLSLSRRDNMVADFQQGSAAPVLIVSTRAGGTGLNLTAATHVVHYDRWWNPAVEDQATDRAHRIGQTRTVEVHKLVTAGTIEERIAEMLERKRALADAVVGAGESWITELDDAALAELVSLSADAPLVDEIDERQGASR